MKQRRKAAALTYEQGFDAPVVSAAGVGVIADKIIEKAESNVDVGEYIPPELYDAVAHVIAYITDLDKLIER